GQPDQTMTLDAPTGYATQASCFVPSHSAVDEPTNKPQADGITTKVPAQLLERRTDATVYCSCRCDGPDKNARYCKCPSGYSCTKLIEELGIPGRAQLAGSYCIKEGTAFQPPGPTAECESFSHKCDN